MQKFHANPQTGKISQCHAITKPCPFGEELHGVDRASAEKAYKSFLKGQNSSIINIPKISKGGSLFEPGSLSDYSYRKSLENNTGSRTWVDHPEGERELSFNEKVDVIESRTNRKAQNFYKEYSDYLFSDGSIGDGGVVEVIYSREKEFNKKVFRNFAPLSIRKTIRSYRPGLYDKKSSFYPANAIILNAYSDAMEIRNTLDKIQKINPRIIDKDEIWENVVKDTESITRDSLESVKTSVSRYGEKPTVEQVLRENPKITENLLSFYELSRELKNTLRIVKEMDAETRSQFEVNPVSLVREQSSKLKHLNKAMEIASSDMKQITHS